MTEEPTCDLPTAETGFTALDYRDLRQQLERAVVTRNEKATRAILSNNVNTILGALQDAVADKWQPIETAPKVGSFLVYISDDRRGSLHVCRISQAMNGPIAMIGGLFSWDRPPPTHWQPLPEPPAP